MQLNNQILTRHSTIHLVVPIEDVTGLLTVNKYYNYLFIISIHGAWRKSIIISSTEERLILYPDCFYCQGETQVGYCSAVHYLMMLC